MSFKPDLAKFKMTHLDADTVALMTRRAYDIAGCTKGVAVYLNGSRLPVRMGECILMGMGMKTCLVAYLRMFILE